MESSFQSAYHLDLMEELRAGRSWRWFRVRLLNLPPDSPLVQVLAARAAEEREREQEQPDALEAYVKSMGW